MPADCCVKQLKRGALLFVLAIPSSSKTEIVDILQDRCKIKVKATPVDGKANAALRSFLAEVFGIPKTQIVLVQGQSAKQKSFLLGGLSALSAAAILNDVLGKRQ